MIKFNHIYYCVLVIYFITFFDQIFFSVYMHIIVLSQLQQELSYRFLHANSQVNHSNHQQPQHVQQQQQQQHGFKHPGQQQPVRRGDSGQSMDTSVAPSPAVGGGVVGGGRQQQLHQRPLGFKWCYAHVHIAQQIQQQQQRAKVSP